MNKIGREVCSKLLKMIIFGAFSHLGHFPQVLGQINKWPILKLHDKVRVLHEVKCRIIFILSEDPDWQEGILKLMKNDHF